MIIADTHILVKDPVVFHGWEDSQVPPNATRNGVTAPTFEGGFKGNANFYTLNFVHTQADEVFFTVQFPHARKLISQIHPHVHFAPYAALGNGTYAARWKLEYYLADIAGVMGSIQTVTMDYTWTNEKQWYHLMAVPAAMIDVTAGISAIMECRLYRDNTVTNNFAGKLTLLGFDIHYQYDTYGSRLVAEK
jgi:hypothetical protein